RNVLFSGLRAALLWPVPFLLIPFILRKLGVAGYGTWAVFLAIVSLSSLADLGLGGTLTKQVAEHHATKNWAALGRLISTGLTLDRTYDGDLLQRVLDPSAVCLDGPQTPTGGWAQSGPFPVGRSAGNL